MARYRKKPVEVDAVQYLRSDNETEVREFFGNEYDLCLLYDPTTDRRYIPTLEGRMFISIGDWIIRGVNGEYYPCKPDIFAKTYEPVDITTPLPLSESPALSPSQDLGGD